MAWDWKAKKRTTSTPAAFRWEKVESSVCWWSVELPPQSYTSSAAARPQTLTPTQRLGRGATAAPELGADVRRPDTSIASARPIAAMTGTARDRPILNHLHRYSRHR